LISVTFSREKAAGAFPLEKPSKPVEIAGNPDRAHAHVLPPPWVEANTNHGSVLPPDQFGVAGDRQGDKCLRGGNATPSDAGGARVRAGD
jgi:hypothetical protein